MKPMDEDNGYQENVIKTGLCAFADRFSFGIWVELGAGLW